MNASNPTPIVFIFDRVMHYHRELFVTLEKVLPTFGFRLVLLSGREKIGTVGRAALRKAIVKEQQEFDLTEFPIGSFTVRYQHGLTNILRALKPSVVVSMCHSGTVSEWQILRLKRRLGFKMVAWQCGYEYNPGRIKKSVLGRFVPKFDHHLAYHSHARDYAITHGALASQVTVMHNTINEGKIVAGDKIAARTEVGARYPVLAGRQIVLYVGAVLQEKRLEVVFAALDLMTTPNVAFLVVGDGPHLKELRRHYGDRQDTVFAGQVVDGVGVFFDAAGVFVLPGTGGLAINEAMAHRLAVVSGYADGSADDLVLDGVTGYRLVDGSPTELAARLDAVLTDPVRAHAMGEAGEQRIRGDLSFERFIQRVVGVLTTAQHK